MNVGAGADRWTNGDYCASAGRTHSETRFGLRGGGGGGMRYRRLLLLPRQRRRRSRQVYELDRQRGAAQAARVVVELKERVERVGPLQQKRATSGTRVAQLGLVHEQQVGHVVLVELRVRLGRLVGLEQLVLLVGRPVVALRDDRLLRNGQRLRLQVGVQHLAIAMRTLRGARSRMRRELLRESGIFDSGHRVFL